ncbi:TPA: excinuclease ABC subunit C [Candidatus Falkowbacteria bacterium]|nr:excinuclease ABC subunit C [Candidatus Falkowbacteria bacterium]
MVKKFYYVYVLQSLKDNKFYIGYSAEVDRRVLEHQRGENVSTAKRLPMILVFYEAYLSKKDALRREKYFKTTKGKTTLRQMIRETLVESQTH